VTGSTKFEPAFRLNCYHTRINSTPPNDSCN